MLLVMGRACAEKYHFMENKIKFRWLIFYAGDLDFCPNLSNYIKPYNLIPSTVINDPSALYSPVLFPQTPFNPCFLLDPKGLFSFGNLFQFWSFCCYSQITNHLVVH